MLLTTSAFWPDRLKASAIHLLASLVVAALAAALVFGLWYPYPYREISGGRELFLLVVTVDVILGPLITLAVFNRSKPRQELVRDLAVVVLIQWAALAYGLWTVSVARPVHLVFEIDRFRVVHAIDLPPELLDKTPSGVVALPLTGPTPLAVRPFRDEKESMDATLAALRGVQLGFRPDLWQPYADAIPRVLQAARPVSALKTRFANRAAEIDHLLSAAGAKPDKAVYLPMVGRSFFWTVFLDPATAQIVATMPLDSF
ncbi:MAG: pilus assembly protein [Burkholderiales bacterium]|nr:pilus assembly protein [Burkholderiales bacterium]